MPKSCNRSKLYNTRTQLTIIAPFIDIPMFNVICLQMHIVQMHAGAISKFLYGFASVRLKLVDYLPI